MRTPTLFLIFVTALVLGIAVIAPADAARITLTLVPGDPVGLTTGYTIERSTAGPGGIAGAFTMLATTTTSPYHDDTAVPGVTYRYRAVATNAGGSSPLSNTIIVTAPTDPPPPGGNVKKETCPDPAKSSECRAEVPPYICARRTGGTANVRVLVGTKVLGKPVTVNNSVTPKGKTYELLCEVTPTVINLSVNGVKKLTVPITP